MTALGSLQAAPLDVEMEMQTNVDGVEVETVREIYTQMGMNMEMKMREGERERERERKREREREREKKREKEREREREPSPGSPRRPISYPAWYLLGVFSGFISYWPW